MTHFHSTDSTSEKQLNIDTEFQSLIPPLSSEERELLEASIKSEGCRDAIVVWKGHNTIIDGHNRYSICTTNKLPFNTVEREFDTREDAVIWIARNQLGRRNVPQIIKDKLILLIEDSIAEKAKANQGKRNDILSETDKMFVPINTRKQLAKEGNTSSTGLAQTKIVYAQAPKQIIEAAERGDISRNQAYEVTKALQDAPESVKRQVTEMAERGKVPTATQVKSFIKEGKRQEKETAKSTLPADLLPYDSRYQLHVGDLGIVMAAMQPASVDAIITDPPYPHEFLPVYLKLAKQAKHVLKPGGSLLVMVGQSYLPEILTMMSSEIDYNWTLTYLTPGGQSVQLWDRHVNTFWKPVLWFTNGKYNGDWVGDVLKSDNNDKRFHHWGQSESGMADIIDRFTYPGQTILDPFVGGGTTGVVALKMNRLFIGIDIDSDAIETTRTRIQQRAMESAA